MKQIILFVMLIQLSQASTLTLKKVLASANNNNALTQAIDQERLQLEAKNQADTAPDPMELYGTGTRAYPKNGLNDGYEYSTGLSKKIYLGDTQEQEQAITRLNNEAALLEQDQKILNFKNGLKNLYHQHCLDDSNYQSFYQNYQDFAQLYRKKEKAYKYQEISKIELMQLDIEKNKLYAKLQEIHMISKISKQKLFILGRISHWDKTTLSCSDMYPIRENIIFNEDMFGFSKEAYEKRIQSTQTSLKRYSKSLDSVNLSAQYDNEIDIEKYTVGVSIPLAFTSKRSEQERAAAMYKNSAISYRYEQTMLEKRSIFMELKSTIKSNAITIRAIKDNINDYKKNLLPLMRRSYDLGESPVIEYLLNRQMYSQLKQELFAAQKDYYRTLFTLYTLSETKD